MTSVTGLDGEVTTYAYDAAGRRVETASRNLTTEYKYDVVGSLVEQTTTGSSNLSFQYSYNLNGYITGEVRTENGETITSAYAYDPLGELISFTQSNGYGEQYTYDKAGNMTQKVITPLGSVPNEKGIVENAVTLKMKYNQGNQLVSMTNGSSKITYKYDKNGSMVEKALTSKQYGTLTDTYAYNSLDQLESYTGYDGYQQQFAYDANGMRLSKSEYGNSNRSTLEELLRGEIAGLPEVVVPVAASEDEAAVPAEYEWATTEYLYDITQEYYQVIQQTTTTGNNTTTTAYAYGLERIAAYDANNTTQYIYDGRGSVAQTIFAPVAGAFVSAALPDVQVQSYAYTAFGEQMGTKSSGFGYNAEDYDAATGMINLRMRQYEPAVGRFEQMDVVRGVAKTPCTHNRYEYCYNDPVMFGDAGGMMARITNVANAVINGVLSGINMNRIIASKLEDIVTYTGQKKGRKTSELKAKIQELEPLSPFMKPTTYLQYQSILQYTASQKKMDRDEWKQVHNMCQMLADTHMAENTPNPDPKTTQYLNTVKEYTKEEMVAGRYYIVDYVYDSKGMNNRMEYLLANPDDYAYREKGHKEKDSICCAYCIDFISDPFESHFLAAHYRYTSYEDRGTIESLGGFDKLQVGMEVYQQGEDMEMVHVGKIVLHEFDPEIGLELAVFHSVANELTEDKWDALFYGDTGPNITKLMDKNGNSKWTHYAIPN